MVWGMSGLGKLVSIEDVIKFPDLIETVRTALRAELG